MDARCPEQYPSHEAARKAGQAAYLAAKLQRPWKVVVKTYGTPPWYEWRLVYMTSKHKFSCQQYQDGHWLVFADHKAETEGEEDDTHGMGKHTSLRVAFEFVLRQLKERAQKHVALADTCGRALKRMRGG